ncbi:MAG: radical SAM protein [Methanotrichaceae archaeon]|nr:radical SAM protein [Methanotrichaceae archaeon]
MNIAEGCIGACSYCIVRKARGELDSRRPDDIVESVKKLVKERMVEIQLAAQDTAAYALDIGTNLPELLQELIKNPGRFMIRVGMMIPTTAKPILKDLIEVIRSPKVYKFIHMPVQSGSDRILDTMGRGYLAEDFLRIIKSLREDFPEISLATDVIVGFP